jgi:Bacteriophage Gp15 protein
LVIDSHEEAFELFKYLLREFLDIDLEKKNESGEVNKYDFVKDAELIYASFFAVYKLDLFELQGKLHWRKFEALLLHLDDNSPFKQIIGYRTMKIPTEKQASKEYIQHVRKMQQLYSLEDGPKDVTYVFDSISSTLKSQAKGGDG